MAQFTGTLLECYAAESFRGSGAVPGLSLPPGFLVVWSAHAGARAFDQLAGGLGNGLPAHSGGLHRHGSDNSDGTLTQGVGGRHALVDIQAERH